MTDVRGYIDKHFDSTIGRLARWCAQPSISTENTGVSEMAMLAEQELREMDYKVTVYQTEGYPVIVASQGPVDAPAIVLYDHYDVQPVGDLNEWSSPPFEPQVRGDQMYGRGVADTKSNIVARLDAIEAYKAVRGDLPIRVIWLLEGEEEIGSPHLDKFISEHQNELQADGCIWEFGGYTWDGRPNITLGLKGMLSVELTARGGKRDLHSGMAAFVTSPVWRLVWALATIKGPDGRIQIPGFYDGIAVPTPEQEQLLASIPDETRQDMEGLGIPYFLNDLQGMDVYKASAFDPTANILGIEAGYNGPGTKTVLPREARAKLDIRLVPNQDPDSILRSLQDFLKEKGFVDVEAKRVSNEGDLLPAISNPTAPFIRKVLEACRDASGKEPVITPSSAGSGPMAPFTMPQPRGLGLPTAAIGTGYPDTRAHGPDENIRLPDMKAHMYTVARLIELMSPSGNTN